MITFEDVLVRTPRKLDDNQRAAIMCDDHNCVVSAGAGSGKTTVLSYRFLRLVIEGKAHVDEILTLTFTRKAAAEMHDRIHRQLLEYRDDPYIASELSRFPDASISTLDSFCSRIVRCDCVRYGVSPDFVTDDDACRQLATTCAVQTLEEFSKDPGAMFLSEIYSPEALLDEFLVQYAMSCFILTAPLQAESAVETVLRYFTTQFENLYEPFMNTIERIANLQDQKLKTVAAAVEVCQRLLLELPPLIDSLQWDSAIKLLATATWKSPGATKPDTDADLLKQLTAIHRENLDKLQVVLSAFANQDRLLPVFRFLETYQKRFFEQKRKGGILTFSDVSRMAIDILKSNKTLRSYFKKQFRYIMIDEFQDNNSLQKDLLYLLAEREDAETDGIPTTDMLDPGKLFFVGDEKQSIYLFRGADVSVFKQLKTEIEAVGGVFQELNTNYRSEPYLIEQFNQLFQKVMENSKEPWEADFTSLGTKPQAAGITPSFTLCFKPLAETPQDAQPVGDEEEVEQAHVTEAEAAHLADLIVDMLTTDGYLIPNGKDGVRRPLPSDIAILLRTTSGQLSYEKALRSRGVPYTLQVSRALLLEAPSNDLYNLLQLALYPWDKLAYVASLRSPFCRLSDSGVAALLRLYDHKDSPVLGIPYPSDEASLERIRLDICDDDFNRYILAHEIFGGLLERVGRQSISQLLSYLWYDCGYRNYLVTNSSYQVYLEHYDFLWALARKYDQRGDSLSAFLDFLRPRLGENEKLPELELLHEDAQGVQIMTIHKSKGLEFPIVIVAGMGTKGERTATPPFYPCDGVALPFHMDITTIQGKKTVKNGCYFLDEDHRTRLAQAELKRLLYVAATRAETHLVFSGCENRQNHGPDATFSNLLYMFIRNSGIDEETMDAKDSGIRIRFIEDIPAASLYASTATPLAEQPDIARKLAWYRDANIQPVDTSPLRYSVTALVGAGVGFSPVLDAEWHPDPLKQLPALVSDPILRDNALTARFGTYTHAIVELLLSDDLADTSPKYLAQFFPEGQPENLSSAEFNQILSDGLSLAQNFLSSSLWKELSAYPEKKVECEVPFFSRMNHEGCSVVVEGAIDLLVTLPDRQFVVDFKTDAIREPEVHERQVRTYMEAIHRIYSVPVAGTICFLRQPGGEVWIDYSATLQ